MKRFLRHVGTFKTLDAPQRLKCCECGMKWGQKLPGNHCKGVGVDGNEVAFYFLWRDEGVTKPGEDQGVVTAGFWNGIRCELL